MYNNIHSIVEELSTHLDLNFTPGGLWAWDKDISKKTPIDAKRVDYLPWDNFMGDNMSRVYLNKEYIVIDVDGRFVKELDGKLILKDTAITLPLTFYTVTSSANNIHAWYKLPARLTELLPTRTVSIVEEDIDTFTLGTIFEGHLYERGIYTIHSHPIVEIDDTHPFIATLMAYQRSNPIRQSKDLYPVSQPAKAVALAKFMSEGFMDEKKGVRNNILKVLLPRAYHPSKGERPDLIKSKLSYTLINDMATKLSAVSELSTEVVGKFLRLYITRLGYNPDHNNLLAVNILGSLPTRDAILPPDLEDGYTIEELVAQQPNTNTPVFKTSVPGKTAKKVYIRIDGITQEPILFNGTPYIEESLMPDFNPERTLYGPEGQVVGWDTNVPLVQTITCPYTPPISYRDTPIINLYIPTEYLKQATPKRMSRPQDNLVYKVVDSVVPNSVLHTYLAYYHMTIWGDNPPIMIPWLATGPNTPGGTGKSIVTLTILAKVLGKAASKISATDAFSGWGDVLVGKRHVSLEDCEKLSPKDAERLDAWLKSIHSASDQTINMKGANVLNEQIKLSASGSSNHIPYTTTAQRRTLAIEPAHLDEDEPNMPLTQEEADKIDMLFREEYSPILQEFVDHLYYLHQEPLTREMYAWLYSVAPHTKYKDQWIGNNRNFSARVYGLINHPNDLMSILHAPDTVGDGIDMASAVPLVELLQYLLIMTKDNNVTPLSWVWYRHLLTHVQDTEDISKILNKAKESIRLSLGVDKFTSNCRCQELESKLTPTEIGMIDSRLIGMPAAGPVPMRLSAESVEEYKKIIKTIQKDNK